MRIWGSGFGVGDSGDLGVARGRLQAKRGGAGRQEGQAGRVESWACGWRWVGVWYGHCSSGGMVMRLMGGLAMREFGGVAGMTVNHASFFA